MKTIKQQLGEEETAKWAAALRSGEYKQGRGRLRFTSGLTGETTHCCLGVLAVVKGLKLSTDGCSIEGDGSNINYKALGLEKEHTETLVEMNDRGQATFAQIADYIENN